MTKRVPMGWLLASALFVALGVACGGDDAAGPEPGSVSKVDLGESRLKAAVDKDVASYKWAAGCSFQESLGQSVPETVIRLASLPGKVGSEYAVGASGSYSDGTLVGTLYAKNYSGPPVELQRLDGDGFVCFKPK